MEDYFKLGPALFNFEHRFKLNSLIYSNLEGSATVSSQSNQKASKKKLTLWKCEEDLDMTVKEKKGGTSNVLCLLMAYKLKKAIFNAHPDIWKQSQLSVQNENSERLGSNDEDRIFIIQNTQMKRIIVKSEIDDLEMEQGYDTLVIPSDIYQNDDSLQKFTQVYKKFWDENKMENFIK
ncbi:hypothetical protein HMI56_005035, partial [Coelomomyces lativittatus]